MSNPGDADATPITSTKQLADYLAAGCKPHSAFRIGTEHEKFAFRTSDLLPPVYGANDRPGVAGHSNAPTIRALIERLSNLHGEPIIDRGNPIGVKQNGAAISLEPAGQVELSGAAVTTLHETRAELEAHFAEVRSVGTELGLGFMPLGFHPVQPRAAMPWMPKGRYQIMRRYMPLMGRLGLDMMLRTCTVQVNLDFSSEADMVRKLRVSLALQPLATALFANSPFTEGRPNGFQSFRAEVWTDTDPDRTGMPAVMFERGFGFERYVEWLLDTPMYFIYRNHQYVDLAGCSFRDFLAGRLPQASGQVATIGDFADHVTTVFTDVRIKRFLEMRGADAGSPAMMLAQSAFWIGLLYDDSALAAAESLIGRLERGDLLLLRREVPRRGLATPWLQGTLRDLARDAVAIASDGLRARKLLDETGRDEATYLAPLAEIVAGGPTQAENWLHRYNGPWQGDVTRIFHEAAI